MPNPPYLCLVLLLLSTAALVVAQPPYIQWECLSVPASVFTTTLQSTIDGVRKVASLVEKFTGVVSSDFRVANAVSDCVDLLDLSSEELSWSLSASQTGKDNGTGNLGSDLKTWLSASLANVDTCIEGFQGTNSFVKSLVSSSLNQLTSLVTQVLHMVHDVPAPSDSSKGGRAGKGGGGYRHGEFPSWISPKDRRLLQASGTPKPDIVVAQDGTSNFTKVVDAVEAARDYGTKRFVIYVKKGVYDEIVEIKKKKNNIMMVGDGIDATVITGNRSCIDGWTTYRSATFAVKGTGFIARDITFQNTAGPEKHQAVAYRSDSDLSALYRCAFRGYQDTLYTHANRQFFRECTITGTVDFMFGNAAAVFQGCTILARKGLSNQKNTVTAQGRKDPGQNSGFSIQFSNITADPELQASSNSTQTYLGRPWKQYSRTVIMESYIGPAVRPEGWLEWNASQYLDTLYYAEYMNYGPRSGLAGRVKWPGFHVLNSSADAVNFTVAQFIEGNLWLPPTGVRFTAGLSQA